MNLRKLLMDFVKLRGFVGLKDLVVLHGMEDFVVPYDYLPLKACGVSMYFVVLDVLKERVMVVKG